MAEKRQTSGRSEVGANERDTREGHSGRGKVADTELDRWLREQAAKLKRLESKSWKLRAAYLANAREKGAVLLEVEARLPGTSMTLRQWVEEYTDIGYSTALLWKDVAANFDLVEKRFADSNPLELTLTQVRDAIRDARQEQGRGKPGSGRRVLPPANTPDDDESDAEVASSPAEQEDAEAGEKVVPSVERWEREAAKAEAEAAAVGNGPEKSKPRLYKVTVMVFSPEDQAAMQECFSDWSPITNMPVGNKQSRSVTASVPPKGVGTLLRKLGGLLEGEQPMKVRVSIET